MENKQYDSIVFLFMAISAFGMCCGYFDKMLNNQISMESFYTRRYHKILPFFAVLVLLDVVLSPSKAALIEGIADISLLFGLFSNNISVIGVGWFLGLIFAFYLIFPFYCVLIKSKKRAWIAFGVSVLLNYIFGSYFGINRTNIVYCLPYFLAGGLVYLYRNELEQFGRKYWQIAFAGVIICAILYYAIGANTITMLLVSAVLLIFALRSSGGVLQNRFTRFVSSISMEIYLSHMVMFRVIEKLHINTMFGNGWIQYAVTVILTVCGAIVFSVVLKKGLEIAGEILNRKILKNKNADKLCGF